MHHLTPTRRHAKAFIMFAGLAFIGAVQAAEQQASFAVAITLHAISKPLAASMLCPEGKPLDRVGVAISVSCPSAPDPLVSTSDIEVLRKSGRASAGPTVLVTF